MNKFFQCRDCGTFVTWRTSKKGNRYLAVQKDWTGEFASRTYYPAHRCTPNPEWKAQHEQLKLDEIHRAQVEGRIIVGVVVDVVRGRKVPVGTRAQVVWIGEDHYDPHCVRVALDVDGDRQYTSSRNVEVTAITEVNN